MPALRNVSTEAVLRYWRTSVADEMVASLDSMSKGYEVEPADVAKGQLPREAVQWLQARANEKPASQKAALDAGDMEPDAEPLNIVFCLKVMSPNLSHAAAGQHRSLHFVAGVQAVLQPDGRVLKTDNTMPWINRAYLSPSDDDTSVGEVQTSDEWMRDHPMLAENWTQMLEWFDSYWAAVTKGALPKHYAVSQVQMVDIDPKGAKGALTHILKLYDHILETSQRSALMSRFCLGRADHQVITTATRLSSFSAQRGTMSIRHGLANSQADAVAAFTLLQPGEVLAVKGPPGTGKTTLLQSIVATETVRSAMAGLEPSVIVGVSTNNNAVTNISESMNAILRENDMAGRPAWARRWIKDVESYGLYIPSPGKLPAAQKANLVVAYSTGNRAENWSGLPQRERNRTTGDAERAAWLQSCSGVYGNTDSILSGCEQIRADLHVLEHRLSGLQKALQSKHELDVYWLDRMGPDGSAREFVDNARAGHHARLTELKLLVEAAEAETRHHKHKLDLLRDEQEAEKQAAASRLGGQQALLTRARILKGDILAAIAPSGLMEFCALLMPSLRAGAAARQCIRARTLVTEHELSPGFHHVLGSQQPAAWSMAAAEVVGHLEGVVAAMLDEVSPYASSQSDIRDATRKLGAAEKSLAEATTNKDLARRAADVDLAELDGKLHSWTSATVALRASASVLASDYSLLEPVALDIVELDRLADCSVRAEMFQKAMRYWEGRWLMESEKIQSQLLSPPTGANKAGVTARLRRWSMLTPILVSTLHMLPKLLGCYGRVEKEHYCYDLIDVLVMDESGQVAPHLAGAAFSLAKRSVVVGDIYQLEPIVNLSPAADYGNAVRRGWQASGRKTEHPIAAWLRPSRTGCLRAR